jgi:acyl carrier protein
MEELSIEDRVSRILENIVLQGYPIDSLSTWEEMGLDSADKIEMMMDMEEEFGIDIPDEAMELIDTFSELVEYITRIAE